MVVIVVVMVLVVVVVVAVVAEQQTQLHWCNLSVTSVTYYNIIMLQCRLTCQPHTYWWLRIKSFCRSFPVSVNKNCVCVSTISSDTVGILTAKIKIFRCRKCICYPLTIWWKGHNICCTEHATIQHTVKQFCLYEVKNNTEFNLGSTYSFIIYQLAYKWPCGFCCGCGWYVIPNTQYTHVCTTFPRAHCIFPAACSLHSLRFTPTHWLVFFH